MELLTTGEAARYLRLKQRKLYELVAAQSIPCTKVTGRWLFPKADLDRWVASGLVRPEGLSQPDPMPIMGGSHDPLLEWCLRESGSNLAMLNEGSEAGLARFCKGEIVATALHFHEMGDGEADANVIAVRSQVGLRDVVLIAFARREQGLLLAPGNPKHLNGVADVIAAGARVALRQQGAGAQLLLLSLLKKQGASLDELVRVERICPTGTDVAQAIRAGRADCGIATRSVASAAGLEFKPLLWERFDLLMRQRDYFREPLQTLIRFMTSPHAAAQAGEMGGYELSGTGSARYVP
jgi:putative molybdopterin biosynthesis protein